MATLPSEVRPGDLISADLMNAILEQLQTSGGAGTETVPDVFGTFLGNARTMILPPAHQLALGFIFDVGGTAIDPNASANAGLVVLNQSPTAGTRVDPGTPVNLVVSASSSSSTPAPAPAPTISGTETIGGTATSSFPVGGTVVIVGTNFSGTAAQNTVTFDNIPAATVTGDPMDPTRRLFAVIPSGIPGAPVLSGDPPKSGVVVRVQTTNPTPATVTLTLTAPVAGQPTIGGVAPGTQFEGQNITITGTNFTAATQVRIRDVNAVIVSVSPTSIVATVPNFADITPGPPISASVKVIISGTGEATFTGTFRVRGV